MKAFVCFAILAVASAIPLKDSEQVSIPESPIPIPFEMLRNAAAFPMPIWRDLPINVLPEGDVFVALPIPDRMLRDSINDFQVTNVKFVDAAMPSNVASEIILNNDIVADKVKLAYALEPEVLSVNNIDVPAVASEFIPNEIVADKVKVVYAAEPALASNDNIDVPAEASEVIPNEIVADKVKIVYAAEPELASDDNVDVPAEASDVIPEEIVASKVKVVDMPELPTPEAENHEAVKFVDAFDLYNIKVPVDAHDVI